MHRFKKAKQSPRTIYNGPFVLLPDVIAQGGTISPPSQPGDRHFFQRFSSSAVDPATPRSQTLEKVDLYSPITPNTSRTSPFTFRSSVPIASSPATVLYNQNQATINSGSRLKTNNDVFRIEPKTTGVIPLTSSCSSLSNLLPLSPVYCAATTAMTPVRKIPRASTQYTSSTPCHSKLQPTAMSAQIPQTTPPSTEGCHPVYNISFLDDSQVQCAGPAPYNISTPRATQPPGNKRYLVNTLRDSPNYQFKPYSNVGQAQKHYIETKHPQAAHPVHDIRNNACSQRGLMYPKVPSNIVSPSLMSAYNIYTQRRSPSMQARPLHHSPTYSTHVPNSRDISPTLKAYTRSNYPAHVYPPISPERQRMLMCSNPFTKHMSQNPYSTLHCGPFSPERFKLQMKGNTLTNNAHFTACSTCNGRCDQTANHYPQIRTAFPFNQNSNIISNGMIRRNAEIETNQTRFPRPNTDVSPGQLKHMPLLNNYGESSRYGSGPIRSYLSQTFDGSSEIQTNTTCSYTVQHDHAQRRDFGLNTAHSFQRRFPKPEFEHIGVTRTSDTLYPTTRINSDAAYSRSCSNIYNAEHKVYDRQIGVTEAGLRVSTEAAPTFLQRPPDHQRKFDRHNDMVVDHPHLNTEHIYDRQAPAMLTNNSRQRYNFSNSNRLTNLQTEQYVIALNQHDKRRMYNTPLHEMPVSSTRDKQVYVNRPHKIDILPVVRSMLSAKPIHSYEATHQQQEGHESFYPNNEPFEKDVLMTPQSRRGPLLVDKSTQFTPDTNWYDDHHKYCHSSQSGQPAHAHHIDYGHENLMHSYVTTKRPMGNSQNSNERYSNQRSVDRQCQANAPLNTRIKRHNVCHDIPSDDRTKYSNAYFNIGMDNDFHHKERVDDTQRNQLQDQRTSQQNRLHTDIPGNHEQYSTDACHNRKNSHDNIRYNEHFKNKSTNSIHKNAQVKGQNNNLNARLKNRDSFSQKHRSYFRQNNADTNDANNCKNPYRAELIAEKDGAAKNSTAPQSGYEPRLPRIKDNALTHQSSINKLGNRLWPNRSHSRVNRSSQHFKSGNHSNGDFVEATANADRCQTEPLKARSKDTTEAVENAARETNDAHTSAGVEPKSGTNLHEFKDEQRKQNECTLKVSTVAQPQLPRGEKYNGIADAHVERRPYETQCLDRSSFCQLNRLIQEIKSSFATNPSFGNRKSKVSTVWLVDKHCVKNRLKLLAIYKGIHEPHECLIITCDLYLCERFVGQGQASNRKLAQDKAYKSACSVLQSLGKAQDLLARPILDEKEFKSSEVIDIVHKGYLVVEESNLCRLHRIKLPPPEQRTLEHLIILEHEDWSRDRKKHAHCILVQSATQCGCLLEWRTEPFRRGFRCTMKLQQENVATCVTKLRKESIRLASVKTLFRLYETQPVIQGFHINYPQVWTNRATMLEQVKHITDMPAQEPVSSEKENQLEEKAQIEPQVESAIRRMVGQFNQSASLEVMATAPDWRPEEKRCLRGVAGEIGLRVVTENYCEDQILVVSHKHSLHEVYEILQKRPGHTEGRYRILRDEQKPCYLDVAGEISACESVLELRPPGCANERDIDGFDRRSKPLNIGSNECAADELDKHSAFVSLTNKAVSRHKEAHKVVKENRDAQVNVTSDIPKTQHEVEKMQSVGTSDRETMQPSSVKEKGKISDVKCNTQTKLQARERLVLSPITLMDNFEGRTEVDTTIQNIPVSKDNGPVLGIQKLIEQDSKPDTIEGCQNSNESHAMNALITGENEPEGNTISKGIQSTKGEISSDDSDVFVTANNTTETCVASGTNINDQDKGSISHEEILGDELPASKGVPANTTETKIDNMASNKTPAFSDKKLQIYQDMSQHNIDNSRKLNRNISNLKNKSVKDSTSEIHQSNILVDLGSPIDELHCRPRITSTPNSEISSRMLREISNPQDALPIYLSSNHVNNTKRGFRQLKITSDQTSKTSKSSTNFVISPNDIADQSPLDKTETLTRPSSYKESPKTLSLSLSSLHPLSWLQKFPYPSTSSSVATPPPDDAVFVVESETTKQQDEGWTRQRSRSKTGNAIADVEACRRSPEQEAVCLYGDQNSRCVRFSSEFEMCDETVQEQFNKNK